jgi:hypothetical protein
MHNRHQGLAYFDKTEQVWRTMAPNTMFKDFTSLDGKNGLLAHLAGKLAEDQKKAE